MLRNLCLSNRPDIFRIVICFRHLKESNIKRIYTMLRKFPTNDGVVVNLVLTLIIGKERFIISNAFNAWLATKFYMNF